MEKKDVDGQLEAFFEHNPLDDDMVYLKQFVKDHPDNKMGWYLLGKEYAVRGKEGKAKYCFAQSGEVYEAFEKKQMRLGMMDTIKAEQPILPGQITRKGKVIRAGKLVAAVLIALLAGSYLLPEKNDRAEQVEQPTQQTAPPDSNAEGAPGKEQELRVLFKSPLDGKIDEGEMWKRLLLSPTETHGETLLAEGYPTSDGKWVNGARTPALLMSSTVTDGGEGLRVAYHQARYCDCTPQAASAGTQKSLTDWQAAQEEEAVLRSAVKAYMQRYGGELPESIDGLIRDYPNNLLPGYTDRMKRMYQTIAGQQKLPPSGEAASGSGGIPGGVKGSAAKGGAAGPSPYGEPLAIVVDTKAHRLALVSGKTILRSYPVGLGGSRTPEGQFTITDKVKNPNGRDDGDFGSRGMQLSDTNYAIHGTNQPKSIGEDMSLGCVRMLKADVEELFDMAPSGTQVTIGPGLLPEDVIRKEAVFRLPALREETNPRKIYKWL